MTYTLIEITNLLNLNVQEICYMLSIKNKMDIYDTDCRLWVHVHNLHTKLRHCLSLHFCLILFGPPNFFMSCQNIKNTGMYYATQRGKLFQHETISGRFDMHAKHK